MRPGLGRGIVSALVVEAALVALVAWVFVIR